MDKDKIKITDNIDPGDILERKDSQSTRMENEEELMTVDLDVPGAELDDEMEEIGNEDEENNYYSLGGERHHDLEE